jgi:carboxyl-terminal processing protease
MTIPHPSRRVRHLLGALSLAFVSSWLFTTAAANSKALSAADHAAVFDEVWQRIAERYYDPAFNGVDWNSVRARYRPQIGAVENDAQFYALLNRMTGELRDAHTRVRTPQQAALREKRKRTEVGVLIYEVEGQSVIFDVTPESEAMRLGVKPGMLVRAVGGQPIARALAEARAEVGPSSSERAAKILTYLKLVSGDVGDSLQLGLVTPDGAPLNVSLPRREVSAAPQVLSRQLPSGVGYIRISRFRAPASEQVKQALEKFRDAPGVVLDLRANTGGDGKEGLRVAACFFDRKVPIARVLTRTGKPPSVFFGLVTLPKVLEADPKNRQAYAGPLAVLVNEGTGSTSELIAAAMQEHKRAFVIGTPTAGAVLGVLDHHKLRGGGTLAISELGLVTPAGKRLEGKGVTPDRLVPLTLRDLQSQRDAALAAAEEHLRQVRSRGTSM